MPTVTPAELAKLDPPTREALNQHRRRYILTERVYLTADVRNIEKAARRMLLRCEQPTSVVRRGLRISGPSATGKSTAVLHVGRLLDDALRVRTNRRGDASYLPVVYVPIGEVTSANKLWTAFAQFLGIELPKRGNADDRMYIIASLLREMGTRFVIVDEVHHLQIQKTQGAEAANALKRFAEQFDASMIYTGIDLDTAPLFTGKAGAQWRARTVPYDMRTYSVRQEGSRDEWTELVNAFAADLPLARHRHDSLESHADYLYHRTGGSIGALKNLLQDAAIDAIENGSETITRKLLDTVTIDLEAIEYATIHPYTNPQRKRGKAQ
ncbi:TniB family NTP-binding protein [Nocardia tengchongensis]